MRRAPVTGRSKSGAGSPTPFLFCPKYPGVRGRAPVRRKSADHIREISARLREYGARVREAIDTTDEAGDADTADILTAASQQADKDLWFIESHLE